VFLNLCHAGRALVSRVAPSQVPARGSVLHLGFAGERLHFFDAASGARIV
jgi:multiple sugar transport system ATP-binding protein